MRLLAISDLHIGRPGNREALAGMPPHPDDWLILAGDVGEKIEHLEFALDLLSPRFAKLVWVPGNHELWATPRNHPDLRGEARYLELVGLCRSYGALTPEDPYAIWNGEGPSTVIVPLMVLYDYTFRPDDVAAEDAVAWARAAGVKCADERHLHPVPYESRSAWCEARVAYSEQRMSEIPDHHQTILINHFPLRREHARLPRVPRFSIWCGTRHTEDWHTRFNARVVVSGHIHIRTTRFLDGVRFEEVSLGYPRQWHQELGLLSYLREILPGNEALKGDTIWL